MKGRKAGHEVEGICHISDKQLVQNMSGTATNQQGDQNLTLKMSRGHSVSPVIWKMHIKTTIKYQHIFKWLKFKKTNKPTLITEY